VFFARCHRAKKNRLSKLLAPRRNLTEPEAAQKREALQDAGFYGGSVYPTDARLS